MQKQIGFDIPDHLDNFKGLGKRMPFAALSMTIFVFALAGIPPTAGFMAKFVLFSSAIQAGMTWLAVIAVLNSALSLFYYARLVRYMYFLPPEGKKIGIAFPICSSSPACSGRRAGNGLLARTLHAVGNGSSKGT